MRVYRDLELVEQLGSGIPQILESYGKECFRFMGNFIRMIFPASEVVTPQVTPQVKELIKVFETVHNRTELQSILGLLDREHFRKSYLQPAIDAGLVALTIPDKPTSSKQRYVLTDLGKQLKHIQKKEYTK